jgi:PA14 domain/Dolichyl-phosphate-mannose-protein mannosyltransferase
LYRSDTRIRLALLSFATLVLVVLALARKFDPLPEGLTATHFPDIDWSATPLPQILDPRPSTDSIVSAWHGNPPPMFSTTWIGSFATVRPGPYTFGTVSDDGSWVYVDGRLVVENGGRHEDAGATGTVVLDRGVHEIFVKYFQAGGALDFRLLWARGDAPLEPIPSWALFPRRAEFARLLTGIVIRRAAPVAFWLWIGTLVFIGGLSLLHPAARAFEILNADRSLAALASIVTGSCILNAIGIWWGLPSLWVGDEVIPVSELTAIAQRFSNGWFDRYPPLHFELLGVVFSPWLVAASHGWIHAPDDVHLITLVLLSRFLSVAAGAGTLIAIYLCGSRAFGRRAGILGAAMMALVTPFVFYSKTANVEAPYVFWFALSLVFFVRWLRSYASRDAVLFALAATLAVCTKDQAYGLYLTAPFVMIFAVWQRNRARQRSMAVVRAVLDAQLWMAAAGAVAIFALVHNVAFNPSGFMAHLRDITTSRLGYRMVESTLAGRLELLRLTLDLNLRSWGWPFWIVTLAGVIVAFKEPESRRVAVCLALVIASYYVGFINVILYNYDRFLVPICVVQAMFGGVALDRFLSPSTRSVRPLRVALVASAFAYTFLYTATVDDLMVRDSRYTVERWLDGHVGADDQIGTVFPGIVQPRLGHFRKIDIGTLETLQRWAPAFFVLNADYARSTPPDTPAGQLIAGLQQEKAGYRRVFRYRSPSSWPWLPAPHPDLTGPRIEAPVSFLRDINPTMEVFERSR